MKRSELVEVVRCAADLALETLVPVRGACLLREAPLSIVVAEIERALGRPRRREPDNLHWDLLEAAQRIEEGL